MPSERNDQRSAAVRDILEDAKRLATRYYALTGKPLGVTGEVAELEAAEKLHLVLTSARNPAYDAHCMIDGKIERFQIKGRAVHSEDRYRGRVPSIKYNGDFEWVLLVLLDCSTYSALEIWQATRRDVQGRLEAPGSKARNERNSMRITQFTSIARKAWPRIGTEVEPNRNRKASLPREKISRGDAIHYGNLHCKPAQMHGCNTRFANINAKKDVWWLDLPCQMITRSSLDYLHLLLYDHRPEQQGFHHLKVPICYIADHIARLRLRELEDKISLELSSERAKLFQDVIGPGKIPFLQFRHCSFTASPQF